MDCRPRATCRGCTGLFAPCENWKNVCSPVCLRIVKRRLKKAWREAESVMVWTVKDIFDYLAQFQGTILLDGKGAPSLKLPLHPCDKWGNAVDRDSILDTILPQLKARREEVVRWCVESNPDVRASEEYKERKAAEEEEAAARKAREIVAAEKARVAGPKAARRAAIEAVLREAEGRVVWYMICRPKLEMKEAGKKGIPLEAHFICIEGGTKWVKLPMTQPDKPGKKVKKKRGNWTWNGG